MTWCARASHSTGCARAIPGNLALALGLHRVFDSNSALLLGYACAVEGCYFRGFGNPALLLRYTRAVMGDLSLRIGLLSLRIGLLFLLKSKEADGHGDQERHTDDCREDPGPP